MTTSKPTHKARPKRSAGKSTTPNRPASKRKKSTTPTYMKFFYGLMLVALLMGSFARIARKKPTATPLAPMPTTAQALAPTSLPATGNPDQVVRDFLTAYETDPTGKSELAYLSLELQDAVLSGASLPTLLGLESSFTAFDTVVINQGQAGKATVRATLQLTNPYDITFDLSDETGTWRITHIQPQTAPVDHSGG